MCAARMINLWVTEVQMRRRSRGMMSGEFERPLLIISTVVVLSEWMSMLLRDHSWPQRSVATTIGYISWRAEGGWVWEVGEC